MLVNKAKPIEYPIAVNPGQVIVVELRTKGGGNYNIKVDLYVHYLLDRRGRSTNVVNSGMVTINSEDNKLHTVKLIAPQFNVTNAIKSTVNITTDSYKVIGIEDLVIANEFDFEAKKRRISGGIGGAFGLGPSGVPKPLETSGVAGIDITASNLVLGYDLIFKELGNKFLGLPDDSLNRVWYMRPWTNDSFGLVGWYHIYYMEGKEESGFEIIDITYDALMDSVWMNWTERRNILLHPFLYPFATTYKLNENIQNFAKLLGMKKKIGGFDVSDSDKISSIAVLLINKLDLIMVPSGWCRDAYIRSGVRPEIVQVLEHGISNEMLYGFEDNTDEIKLNNEIKMLRELKKNGNILITFFKVHSDWRKGSDLVAAVMRRIQRKPGMGKVILVVKGVCDTGMIFPGVRAVSVRGWLDNNDLRRLYDISDICLSPSRGGGFELNSLEAVSRGIPTLVSNGGCFTDLMQYYIGVNIGRNVQPLPGNPIHIGMGPECDINDFEKKLEDVILNLDKYKDIFKKRSFEIRKRYTWKNTALKLENILRDYDFIR